MRFPKHKLRTTSKRADCLRLSDLLTNSAWDFMSLHEQTTHMQTWILSDRAIPRSFRMMQGFGGEFGS